MRDGLLKQILSTSIALAVMSPQAKALELLVEAGYEARYTDNVGLTSNDKDAAWIQSPQLAVSGAHEGPSVTASANYSLQKEFYQDNAFDDQTTATGTALLSWRAIADRLLFDFSNSSTQTTIDSRGANVPSNQQVTNTATAAATLNIDGPSNHRIDLGYQYAVVTEQRSDTDSKRQTGSFAYIVPISPKRQIQLNASIEDVNYDSEQNPDYLSKSANLRYVNQGDQVDFDSSVGYTVFDRSQQADNVAGVVGNFNVAWHVSERTNVSASYARSIEDQSTNVTAGIPQFGQEFSDNTGTITPYTLDTFTLGITTQLGHNSLDLTGYIEDQNYDDGGVVTPTNGNDADQNTKGVALGISRALRQTLKARIYANYSTVDYKDQGNQDNYSSGLRLDWTRWRNLTVSAGTTYTKRESDIPFEEYTEWAGTIGFMYALVGGRR